MTFADGGTATIDFGSADDAAAAAVRPDGRILLFGNQAQAAAAPVPRVFTAATQAASGSGAIMARLMGGSRTGLPVRLAKTPSSSPVTVRLRNGRATFKTSGSLTCRGAAGSTAKAVPVGGCTLTLWRSRDGHTWSKVATGTTGKTGVVTKARTLTRRGRYWFRWKFAGTQAYRNAVSASTQVIVR